jgi:hypothetical protein
MDRESLQDYPLGEYTVTNSTAKGGIDVNTRT